MNKYAFRLNSTERLAAIGRHYGVATAYPGHQILDHLDRKAGITTKGAVKFSASSPSINYVGTRIRLHEEHIKSTVVRPYHYFFWLGAEGERLGKTLYMQLKGYKA